MRREPQKFIRTALHWTPGGKRKRERKATTTRRGTVKAEMRAMQHSWGSVRRLAQDRQKWRDFVAAMDTTGCNGS